MWRQGQLTRETMEEVSKELRIYCSKCSKNTRDETAHHHCEPAISQLLVRRNSEFIAASREPSPEHVATRKQNAESYYLHFHNQAQNHILLLLLLSSDYFCCYFLAVHKMVRWELGRGRKQSYVPKTIQSLVKPSLLGIDLTS